MQVACGSGVVGKGGVDVPRQPGGQPVGQPGQGVLLVQHDRQAEPPGGQVGRGGHVAAEAQHAPGPPTRRSTATVACTARSSRGPTRARSEAGPPRHRHRRDQLQRQPGGRDHRGLQAAGGADRGQPQVRPLGDQLVRGGDQRRGVAGACRRRPGRASRHAHRRVAGEPAVARPGHRGHPRSRPPGPPGQHPAGVGLAPGAAQQHADGQQVGHQRRAAVGEHRQRDAGDRQQPQHDSQVEQALHHEPGGHPAGRVAGERVVGADRDPDPGVAQDAEQGQHHQAAEQAELLAQHGEDEVGVRLGQAAPLLPAGAQPDAPPAAGGDGVHPGAGLVVDARRCSASGPGTRRAAASGPAR